MAEPLDQSNEIYLLKNFQDNLLQNTILRGVKNVESVILRKEPNSMIYVEGKYVKKESWVIDSAGTNLIDVLALDYVDYTRTVSNSITETYNVLGIEAARSTIYNELIEVLADNDTYINEHHLCILIDRMTYCHKMISIFRHGINNDDIGPIAKASFEETPEQFLKAARHAELDVVRGVSASVMCGQEGNFGTNSFQLYLDINQIKQNEAVDDLENSNINTDDIINAEFNITNYDNICSKDKLTINNNSVNIIAEDLGIMDDAYEIDI